MMKVLTERFSRNLSRHEIEREVDEELRFHLDSLTQENLRQDISWEEAKSAATRRFGNVEQIRGECVEISRRNRPFMLAIKSSLILILLIGVLVRALNTELHFTRLGDLLIAIPVLSWLFLYVRGLKPSSFLSKPETSSPLMLNEKAQTSYAPYDQRMRTPLERVISDK